MKPLFTWIASAGLALTLLAGCGGGTPPNITAAAGGTITSADGRVTLTVPAGAASRDMTIRIVNASPTVPSDVGVLAGYGYAIEGDGDALGADAELRFAIDDNLLAASVPVRRHALDFMPDLPSLPSCPEGYAMVAIPDIDNVTCVPLPIPPVPTVVTPTVLTKIDRCLFSLSPRSVVCKIRDLIPKTVVLLHDKTPPTVSMTIAPSPVTVAGPVMFAGGATDNRGVDKVQIYIAKKLSPGWDVDTPQVFLAPPYTLHRSFTSADTGEWIVRIAALDKNNNLGYETFPFEVNIPAPPTPDTIAPIVTLGVNTTVATVGASVTLDASASDNIGVTKVEFYKGVSKIGESLSAPYQLVTAAFTAGDVGSAQAFTARAYDAAGNQGSSAAVTVTVSSVSTGDVYVNAASGADSNVGTAGAPFKTLDKAFTAVSSGGTVWLQNAAVTEATEGTTIVAGRTVPVGVTVRSVNPGGASIGFPLKFAGNGSVIDTAFDMSRNGAVVATTGHVLVSRPTWIKLGAVGGNVVITASGDAKVTMDNGGTAGHAYFAAVGVARLADLSGSAELTVNGGEIDGISGAGSGWMIGVADSARVTLNSVNWTNTTAAVVAPTVINVQSSAGTVLLNNTILDMTGASDFVGGGTACIRLQGPASTTTVVTLDNSQLKRCPGDGIQVREGTPTVTLKSGSAIQNVGGHGLRSSIFGVVPAAPSVTLNNSTISSSARGAIEMLAGGSLSLSNSSGLMFNNTAMANGALRLMGSFNYQLTVRNTTIQNNNGGASAGGIVMQGNASSSFDLGTKASSGANVIKSNGSGSTSLRVEVASGVQVKAVGNNWTASSQSADSLGRYSATSNPCGTNPCSVSGGSGANYNIVSGSLLLVDE